MGFDNFTALNEWLGMESFLQGYMQESEWGVLKWLYHHKGYIF